MFLSGEDIAAAPTASSSEVANRDATVVMSIITDQKL